MLSEKVTKALQNYTKGFSLGNELGKCSYFIQQKNNQNKKLGLFHFPNKRLQGIIE
jgi:hypothetical protein